MYNKNSKTEKHTGSRSLTKHGVFIFYIILFYSLKRALTVRPSVRPTHTVRH